jgi:predicted MPP superfamily phosphohydrolase
LVRALRALKVKPMEGQRTPLGRCELVGIGNLSSGSTHNTLQVLGRNPSSVPGSQRVALTHDPDSAAQLPAGFAAWVLAGHTHGGQMDIPMLTERVLRMATSGHFRQGIYVLPNTRLFVTQGVGMSNLPFRFRVPPTIDVLEL